jgi:Flp pilus assembly pilin Flp
MNVLRRLWKEQDGAIISSELVLVGTMLVIGMVTGINAVQTAVVTELGDTASAIGSVNQSYSYGGIRGHCARTAGSFWIDLPDVCDEVFRQRGDASACLELCTNRNGEGSHQGDN